MSLAMRAAETMMADLPGIVAVYRFGSHGTPHERSDSDIDFAVLGRAPFKPAMIWDVAQELAIKLRRQVDLVDLATASTVLQAQIVTGGERLYCNDAAYCDSYEVYILSAYARLNEERRDIVKDVLSRGTVYGG